MQTKVGNNEEEFVKIELTTNTKAIKNYPT